MPLLANLNDTTGIGLGGTIWKLMGAFHPVVVHFPLALLLSAAFLELLRIVYPENAGLRFAIGINLILGTLGAAVAAPIGWIDATHIHFEPDLSEVLTWHRWLGTAAAIGSLLACALYFHCLRTGEFKHLWFYRVVLWLVAVTLAITGHLGGLLVYGLDYFSS